ncbi:MAG: asparaginase [Chloroflexota bacterium]|nr:asparaginase [Chloroflexota bacterium]
MSVPLVEGSRGPLVETIHRGDVAVVEADGWLRCSAGDPRAKRAFLRSAAKPFQAMPIVYTGAAERWGFDDADLAIFSASHNAEPLHTDRVARVLARIGLGVGHLRCGAHAPLDAETTKALRASGEAPTALHSNCSGKHSGMLALALHLGADTARYLEPDHPVQREILASVARMAGEEPANIPLGVDGCGVPCFGLTVFQAGLAFARLADPSSLLEPYRAAAGRVRDAMRAHPYLVAGRGRFDTNVMTAAAGRVVSKGGASGVQGIGIEGGTAIAVKVEDGGSPPYSQAAVAATEALRQLGALDDVALAALRDHARPAIRNVAGREVGRAQPVFTLVSSG